MSDTAQQHAEKAASADDWPRQRNVGITGQLRPCARRAARAGYPAASGCLCRETRFSTSNGRRLSRLGSVCPAHIHVFMAKSRGEPVHPIHARVHLPPVLNPCAGSHSNGWAFFCAAARIRLKIASRAAGSFTAVRDSAASFSVSSPGTPTPHRHCSHRGKPRWQNAARIELQ